jgi:preprotein translocase subunit SecF
MENQQEKPKEEHKVGHNPSPHVEHKPEHKPEHNTRETGKNWYDKYYKILMVIPIFLVILSLVYLGMFYSKTGDLINKDVSLKGGTTITIPGDIDSAQIEQKLTEKVPDVSFRSLNDLRTGKKIALMIESALAPEDLKKAVEEVLGYQLTEDNSSIEFTGPALSANFYKQLIIALFISFCLMSVVIFVMFKTFTPSIAVIFAAFSDIVMSLAVLDYFGVKISAAGIAAFLMLVGYSVDTDILLTTRALKKSEGTLNQRIYGAFKTGIFMTLTALVAVLPAFFIVTGLPDSFRQIFLILSLGLFADILNTWLTNAGIIKWYCNRKGIK